MKEFKKVGKVTQLSHKLLILLIDKIYIGGDKSIEICFRYMCLEASRELRMIDPKINLRVKNALKPSRSGKWQNVCLNGLTLKI